MPDATDTVQSLDPAIRAFFDATNGEDTSAFLAAFAPGAVLNDWGRVFRGLEAIADWNEHENIGVHSRIEVLGTCPATDGRGGLEVIVKVRGDGYNGGGSFVFTTADALITSVLIQG